MRFILAIFTLTFAALSSCSTAYFSGETVENMNLYISRDTTGKPTYTIPVGKTVLLRKIQKDLVYVSYENYRGYSYNPKYIKYNKKSSGTSSYSTSNSGSGTVHVKGYYRKDGTYVKPHNRSAPKKK